MTFDEIVDSFPGPKKPNGAGGFLVDCPAHASKSKSALSISPGNGNGPLFNCFAGCTVEDILTAKGWNWQDVLPPRDDGPKGRGKRPIITLASLAADKGLPASFLESLGVKDTKGGVHITYRTMDGGDAPRQKLRTAHVAREGSLWLPPKTLPPTCYGLDRLLDAREMGFIVLVEGESDCWTLWFHGIPALGIPGADMTGKIEATHLAGIPVAYYVREPDAGGDTFARGLKTRLSSIGFRGELREVVLDGAKDANDLHKKNPSAFKDAFRKALNCTSSEGMAISRA